MKHLNLIIFLLGFTFYSNAQENMTELTLDLPEPCQVLSIDYIDADELEFIVYPNPTTQWLNVSITANRPLQNPVLNLANLNGQVIYTKKLENNTTQIQEQVKLESLAKGIYILTIQAKDYKASKKIIVK